MRNLGVHLSWYLPLSPHILGDGPDPSTGVLSQALGATMCLAEMTSPEKSHCGIPTKILKRLIFLCMPSSWNVLVSIQLLKYAAHLECWL